MRSTLVAVITATVLALVGCGGGDSGKSSGAGSGGTEKSATAVADEFIACFKKPGYEAVRPKSGQESLFALSAKQHGYAAVPVNVEKPGSVAADAYIVLFKDEATARKAFDDLGARSLGDAPPLERGQAIAGYLDEEAKSALEPAITACL